MAHYQHRFFDQNTGEEVFASDDFSFASMPEINHILRDPELVERFGGPAIIHRIEEEPILDSTSDALRLKIYIDAA